MEGSATFVMVASRTTMNWAMQTRTRTNQRRLSVVDAGGGGAVLTEKAPGWKTEKVVRLAP